MRNAHKILRGKTEGIDYIRKPRCRGDDIIKFNFKEMSCGMNSSGTVQSAEVGSSEPGNESSGFVKREQLI